MVGLDACFDDTRVYNVEVTWGVYDETGAAIDTKTSLADLHGTQPLSGDVECTNIRVPGSFRVVGINFFNTSSAITKI